MIYADYNSTTPCLESVIAAMNEIHGTVYANPSSRHYLAGRQAGNALEQSREHIATVLSCSDQEITFTSGATEATNHIIFGVYARLAKKRTRLLCTQTEHDATLHAMQHCAAAGADFHTLPVNAQGTIDTDALTELLATPTALVSTMLVNNETGVINDIAAIAEICHAHGALLFCDITAAMGKIDINLATLGCDFACSSAHKLYGPKGVGILWKRSGLAIDPLLFGGSQERGLRAGTENIAGIVGYGAACQWYHRHSIQHQQHLLSLSTELENLVRADLANCHIAGSEAARAPGCSMLSVPGLKKTWLSQLKIVAAAGGSACSSGKNSGSHVLLAMGYDDLDAGNSIRISLGHPTTSVDVQIIAEELTAGAKKLL